MNDSTALLVVEDLQYSYQDRMAVKSASLTCYRGEILGLLGPNGAGKTTLLSCIAGLLAGFNGKLTLAGKPFTPADDPVSRERLGMVPQELALYSEMTAKENLEFFARMQGVTAADTPSAVQRGLELAGLVERKDDRVSSYSGGMKRRLNLAVGDMHNPDLLLLDEPTTGVDPQSRNHLFESLLRLRDEGRTLIYTSHYMEEVQRLCDRIVIVNDGIVIGVGTTEELCKQAGPDAENLEQAFLIMTGRSLRDES